MRRAEIARQPQHAGALTSLVNAEARQIKLGNARGREIHVVGEVDKHPVKGRRIGHDPQRVVVHLELALGVLNHDAPASGIVYGIVQRQRSATGKRQGGLAYANALEALAYLVHSGKAGKHPVGHFKICYGFCRKGRIIRLVTGKAGKQQHANNQALFVHAVADNGRGIIAHAYKTVLGCPGEAAVLAVRQGSPHGGTLGKNGNNGRGRCGKFHGAGIKYAAVCCFDTQACAGL